MSIKCSFILEYAGSIRISQVDQGSRHLHGINSLEKGMVGLSNITSPKLGHDQNQGKPERRLFGLDTSCTNYLVKLVLQNLVLQKNLLPMCFSSFLIVQKSVILILFTLLWTTLQARMGSQGCSTQLSRKIPCV